MLKQHYISFHFRAVSDTRSYASRAALGPRVVGPEARKKKGGKKAKNKKKRNVDHSTWAQSRYTHVRARVITREIPTSIFRSVCAAARIYVGATSFVTCTFFTQGADTPSLLDRIYYYLLDARVGLGRAAPKSRCFSSDDVDEKKRWPNTWGIKREISVAVKSAKCRP